MSLDQNLYYRITDLPPAQAITGAEVVEAVQNGKNVKFTLEQLFVGKSAYDVAVEAGYAGTEAQWLVSLKGAKGDKGDAGTNGIDGVIGADGKSAYQIAVLNGFVGTEEQWLDSLKQGPAGADGKSAYELAVEAGFSGSMVLWLASLKGTDGINGTNGTNGASAYDIAVSLGYVGSQAQWLESLKGKNGVDGAAGAPGIVLQTFSQEITLAPGASEILSLATTVKPSMLMKVSAIFVTPRTTDIVVGINNVDHLRLESVEADVNSTLPVFMSDIGALAITCTNRSLQPLTMTINAVWGELG